MPLPLLLAGVLRWREHTSVTSNARASTRRDRPFYRARLTTTLTTGTSTVRRAAACWAQWRTITSWVGRWRVPRSCRTGTSRRCRSVPARSREGRPRAPARAPGGAARVPSTEASYPFDALFLSSSRTRRARSICPEGCRVYVRAGPRGEAFAGHVWVSRRRASSSSHTTGVPRVGGVASPDGGSAGCSSTSTILVSPLGSRSGVSA